MSVCHGQMKYLEAELRFWLRLIRVLTNLIPGMLQARFT
jgi:hypothetical protein